MSYNVTLTLTYPDQATHDAQIGLVCAAWNYQATIDDGTGNMIANPVSKDQFVAARMVQQLYNVAAMQAKKNAQPGVSALAQPTISVSTS